jgi:hydrogenase maturation protease
METLILGYGNTLRSDDGAGQQVAETVAEWSVAGVKAVAIQQLTPDWADAIATAKRVIFVDAVASETEEVAIQPLKPQPNPAILGHTCDPRSLLALAQTLYGNAPEAYLLLIPAFNFEFGETLSLRTQQGVERALAAIRALISD